MKTKDFIIGFASIFLLTSCDNNVVVLSIKNETCYAITGACLLDDSVSDEEIFNDKIYMRINLRPGKLQWVSMPNFKFEDKSDTSKLDLYIFCIDSLVKYRKLGLKKGIVYRSLIKKVVIPSNTIKKQDTIVIKTSCP
jgi:hypothetical protein